MRLLEYIQEAVSHGRRHVKINHAEDLSTDMKIDDFTDFLDRTGYDRMTEIYSDTLLGKKERPIYEVLKRNYSSTIVLVRNDKQPDNMYFRVHFDKDTGTLSYIQYYYGGTRKGAPGAPIYDVGIEALIEYIRIRR